MQILFLNPYHSGSHAAVAEGYVARSRHHVTLLTLPSAAGWRWRMRGAAITFARQARSLPRPDLILATDMLDLATFRTLYGDLSVPTALYFHENQLTYPLPAGRVRDFSFAWINYTSALAADAIFFNSAFHRRSLLAALPQLPGRHHDHQEPDLIESIAAKATVLPPGIDLTGLNGGSLPSTVHRPPSILWNSRWEYDKQPEAFFAALEELEARGVDFRLIVAGEHIDPNAPAFVAARKRWAHYIEQWGYTPNRAAYGALLHHADIVVSTALQEFFGIGVIEALYCGCVPILPNRLTYPDLLPPELHTTCLYDTANQLVEKLITAITHLDELHQYNWPAIAAPYDWALLAPRYDEAFAQVAPRHSL